MSVVRDINAIPETWASGMNWLCFEDTSNKVLCTSLYNGNGNELYGSGFIDKTGKLYDALQSAGLISKTADTKSKDINTPAK
jgi:hypothetical protein